MGGLVLDIFLAYLIKGSVRVFYFFNSSNWERITATITSRTVLHPDWGCSSVKVYYEFLANGLSINAWDEIPLLMHWHAKTYAESLSPGLKPIIRLNPKNPQVTRFFEWDQ